MEGVPKPERPMMIHSQMNLGLLAEHMGSEATEDDARRMRDLLVDDFDGCDLDEVPERDWFAMLDDVAAEDAE